MNLTLLEFIQCPYCRKGLRFLPFSFSSNNVFPGLFNPRKKAKERLLTWLNKKTASLSRRKINSDHHQQGILICTQCYRWYPVVNYLPELLPDHLRDWKRDLNILKKAKSSLNPALRKFLKAKANDLNKKALEKTDKGIDFKYSEIHIKDKVDDPCFFGPGYVAPFNPQNPEFTRQLIRRFGHILHLLNLSERATVLDMGTGYAWTAEWLVKAGHQVFGFDICRTYLEIGLERMKQAAALTLLPEFLVADVEYLPFKNDLFDCILCFDSFHHIVDYNGLSDSGQKRS